MARRVKLTLYYIHVPGEVYAFGPIGAWNKRDARRRYCEMVGLVRCPNGTAVWAKTYF